MRKLPLLVLTLLVTFCLAAAAQTQNKNSSSASTTNKSASPKRGPVFRATRDQIKQAQGILKQRSLYNGEEAGKLTSDTRAGLRKYQQSEGLKVTGTLNKITLEKMGIALTESQK
jgi:peptidoglycan hydrolase-like protein with peptidoglycan-binding domain